MTDAHLNDFYRSLRTGRMFAVLGDLAGPSIFGDAERPTPLEQLRQELSRTGGYESGGGDQLSLSQIMTFLRLGASIDADHAVATARTMPGKPKNALPRLFRSPFYRIYDTSGIDFGTNGLVPDDLPVRQVEANSAGDPFREFVSFVRRQDRDGSSRYEFRAPDSRSDPAWGSMSELNADLITRPGVVITTWPHTELWEFLRARGDLVAKSTVTLPPLFLVTDTQSASVVAYAETLRIKVIDTSVFEFLTKTLSAGHHEVKKASETLKRASDRDGASVGILPLERIIHSGNPKKWAFLRGTDPAWRDITSGDLRPLSIVKRLRNECEFEMGKRTPRILRGRAGSGKTAALMEFAYWAHKTGSYSVGWIDRSATERVSEIIDDAHAGGYDIIVIDNLDQFGERTQELVRSCSRFGKTLVVGSVRTTRGWTIPSSTGRDVSCDTPMDDNDLGVLVDELGAAGFLGSLHQIQDRDVRIRLLRSMCERDLLAALIEVHYGQPFEARIASEYQELSPVDAYVYGLICFMASRVFQTPDLPQDHVMAIVQHEYSSVDAASSIESLVDLGLVFTNGIAYRPRHRAIADLIVEGLAADQDELRRIISSAAIYYARRAGGSFGSSGVARRSLVAVLSHETMARSKLRDDGVREVYEAAQRWLEDDKHFWLQRGAFEVEGGDLDLAARYLETALACPGGAEDFKVVTEWGLMRIAYGRERPSDAEFQQRALEGLRRLVGVVRVQGKQSPHTFTVVLRDGVEWAENATLSRADFAEVIEIIKEVRSTAAKILTENSEVARNLTTYGPRIDRLGSGGSDDSFPVL